jgi:hypothetical protein
VKIFSIFKSSSVIKRKIAISNLSGVTVSSNYASDEFVIHVAKEYDYRYSGVQKKREAILRAVCKQYLEATANKLPFYFKKEADLSSFQTTDDDSKAKINKIPKESPMLLSDEDLQMGLDHFIKLSQNPNQVNQNPNGYQPNVQQGYPTQINPDPPTNNYGMNNNPEPKLPTGNNASFGYKAEIQDPENNGQAKLEFSSKFKAPEDPPQQNYNANVGQMQSPYQQGQMQPQPVTHTGYPQPNFVNSGGFNPNVYNPQGMKMANFNETTSVYVVKKF